MIDSHPHIDIAYLCDHPELIQTVAQWYHKQWRETEEGWSFEQTLAYIFQNDCNKDKLNITQIALDGDKLVGTVQIMKDELLPGWNHVGPWIGGLFIHPEYRHQGIAYRLGYSMMTKAMNMGFENLYMFTDTIHKLAQRHHAIDVGTSTYAGKTVHIYKKELL